PVPSRGGDEARPPPLPHLLRDERQERREEAEQRVERQVERPVGRRGRLGVRGRRAAVARRGAVAPGLDQLEVVVAEPPEEALGLLEGPAVVVVLERAGGVVDQPGAALQQRAAQRPRDRTG